MGKLLGLAMIAVGIAAFIKVNRAAFYRRNQAGIEEFSSYGSAVATGVLNRILRIMGLVLIVAGLRFLWVG